MRAEQLNDDGGDLLQRAAWQAFVDELARQQLTTYEREPLELISHANRERGALEGYRGRQILELLQNADDAADGRTTSRLRIKITRKGVVAANTGHVFSKRGIKSLVISDASPKQLAENRFIGCKGLGFRSVLTWTRSPLVLSGEAAIEFSAKRAELVIRELGRTNRVIREEIERYEANGRQLPVPVMRFPRSMAHEPILDPEFEAWRQQGFATVIVLPFAEDSTGDRAFEDAVGQLKALSPETLLFCRHLESVEVIGDHSAEYALLREGVDGEQHRVLIKDAVGTRMWTVHRRVGRIPDDALANASSVGREYELAVAVPSEIEATSADGRLCVFFPTREQLPMRLRLHGTFEVTEDRNRLVAPHEGNTYVLRELAQLLADTVAFEAAAYGGARALELLDGIHDADPSLRQAGFIATCVDTLTHKKIFPRSDGVLATAGDVRAASHRDWYGILSPEIFVELLDREASRFSSLLASFSLSWFSNAELTSRLQEQVRRLPAGNAGAVVGALLNAFATRDLSVRELILDAELRFLKDDSRCFFHPTGSHALGPLPDWAGPVSFVHPEFQAELLRTSKAGSLRALSDRLQHRGAEIEEYKLDSVARAVIASAEHGISANDQRVRDSRWRELLQWLWRSVERTDDAIADLPVQIPRRGGGVAPAASLLLGNAYPKGQTLERLYGRYGHERFVESPEAVGVSADPSRLETFLIRLGVHCKPMLVDFPYKLREPFLSATLEQQVYPLAVRGAVCRDPTAVRQHCRDISIIGLRIPDHFEQILSDGDAVALVAYLLTDGADLIVGDFDDGAAFRAMLGGERKFWFEPNVRVLNPVLWMLREFPWVPCVDGRRRRPREVILSEVGARAFAGVFWRHAIDVDDPVIRVRASKEAVTALLTRLGAVTSLEGVSDEALYRLLERLPVVDPEGKTAGRIYSTLMEAGVRPGDTAARARFCAEGKVWSSSGVTGRYVPVRAACYNTNLSLPRAVERELPLIDLPRRRNSKVVERLFGVRTLQSDEVRLSVQAAGTVLRPYSDEANAALRRALQFVYAIRLSKRADEDGRERKLLNRIALRVCQRVEVLAHLPNVEPVNIILENSGSGIAVDAELFLVAEYAPDGANAGRFWQWVANLIAEVLGADVSAEVALVLRCRSSDEMADTVRDLVGEGAQAKLDEAALRIDAVEERDPPQRFPLPPAVAPAPQAPEQGEPPPAGVSEVETSSESGQQAVDASLPSNAPSGEATEGEGQGESPPSAGGFSIGSVAPPATRGATRNLVVTGAAGASSGGGGGSPIATEDITFRVVEAFEELATPPRYPIRVSHIRGDSGLGCDLISVATEEIRQRVLRDKVVEDTDIERYIEVKGRSSRTGEIVLDGNEARRAMEARSRYYVYRVFVSAVAGAFEIGVLSDPLFSTALRNVAHLNLGDGSGAQWFTVTEEA